MPSIELVCIGQDRPTDFSHLPFAVESGSEIVSHRRPRPRFRKEFTRMRGCIYHLGNPSLKNCDEGRFFFAYELLSERSRGRSKPKYLQFASEYLSGLREILTTLVNASPFGELLFTSDWQFGPKRTVRGKGMNVNTFWAKHDKYKIMLNASYPIWD